MKRKTSLYSSLWSSSLVVALMLTAQPAQSCTLSDMQHSASSQGLKLRTGQQDVLFRPSTEPLAPTQQPSTTEVIQPSTPYNATQKTLGMLGAALALMLSIALRRSGKR